MIGPDKPPHSDINLKWLLVRCERTRYPPGQVVLGPYGTWMWPLGQDVPLQAPPPPHPISGGRIIRVMEVLQHKCMSNKRMCSSPEMLHIAKSCEWIRVMIWLHTDAVRAKSLQDLWREVSCTARGKWELARLLHKQGATRCQTHREQCSYFLYYIAAETYCWEKGL